MTDLTAIYSRICGFYGFNYDKADFFEFSESFENFTADEISQGFKELKKRNLSYARGKELNCAIIRELNEILNGTKEQQAETAWQIATKTAKKSWSGCVSVAFKDAKIMRAINSAFGNWLNFVDTWNEDKFAKNRFISAYENTLENVVNERFIGSYEAKGFLDDALILCVESETKMREILVKDYYAKNKLLQNKTVEKIAQVVKKIKNA